MKAWFERNKEEIVKWMHLAIITMFAVRSIGDIVDGNASGALGCACACLWCFQSMKWRELAKMQDELLMQLFEKWKKEIETRKDGNE